MIIRKLLTPILLGVVTGKVVSWLNNQNIKEKKKAHDQATVDESSDESFPASDPPAWNSGHRMGKPSNVA